ncbi:MAG: NTP transferase domain-containing protein [Woeseiaceae bacterium]|nr:NTP transferase domain-containing protein [Woeseiaceae bacterium]
MPTEDRATPVYGLVLAGGRSRRMGRDKAALERGGQSQLEYVFGLLAGVADEAYVSARAGQQDDPVRRGFPQIVDRYEDLGPVAGILTALETRPGVDWLVVACDLPNIDRSTLAYLLANRSADKPFTAFRSSYDGLPEPLCAIYRAGSETLIRQFVADGIHCPRKMLIRSDTALLEQPDPHALDNVNTPEDLAGSVLEGAP